MAVLIQPSRGMRKSLNPYRATIRPAPQEQLFTTRSGVCKRHGQTVFRSSKDWRFKNSDGTSPLIVYRCKICYDLKKERNRKKNIKQNAANKKQKLVDAAGGGCKLCGYNKCLMALHFHHLDKASKNFEIAYGLRRLGISKLLEETAKCVLLCNRCHVEVEEGLVSPWL